MSELPEKDSVNLLRPNLEHIASAPAPREEQRKKRRISPGIKLGFFGLCLLFVTAFLFGAGIARTAPQENGDSPSLFASLGRLVRSGDKGIAGEEDDRINVLLLGIGGAGHDGPELTDTIILASFKPSTKELGMISIPRDLTVNIPGYGYRKINAVNALAEQEKDGSGPEATAKTVSDITGQEISYTVKVDFQGFADLIDAIGGVDVYVERDFTDTTYPLDDELGSVETISFTTGWTHMDGATALKFARSRHGGNGEGSDFARAARQQKVILAAKDKMLSLGVLLNPTKLANIVGTIERNIETNISTVDMIQLGKYAPDVDPEHIALHVLDYTSGILYETYVNGAYVLLPYKEDWSDLKLMAQNIFTEEEGSAVPTLAMATNDAPATVTLEIQNGTKTTGLAADTAELLQSSGFTVAHITNAENRDRTKTVIYDFTDGKKDEELAALKEYLRADVYTSEAGYVNAHALVVDEVADMTPFEALVSGGDKVDFLVILGQDSMNLVLR